jgi:hypothetical protein
LASPVPQTARPWRDEGPMGLPAYQKTPTDRPEATLQGLFRTASLARQAEPTPT